MSTRMRLAISRPTRGACGKTGSWRVFRPIVDLEKCNSCGICAMFCPDAAISEDLEIDLDFCKGCGICAHECPKKAIRMEREEK
ncbi:MAG TPA: 4Fe-4S binding protein [Methanolinea sp.]|jgi:pyruvate ferredoxin oxidoreductase delta subunit|nr:MAG: Pyruvate synthase subunit PorD [Methanoregulaceae archaeon PtaB.Bin009]OPY41364.1 MAG: Pyruvate synthase subunit PorD [Methanoregulaceae archaeon PtaU1.Bin066]HII77141.1 4Fe-4S binding protein [Methanolinea sp.]HNQ30619.1 4Fe-4S binding protein [Methanolinea sp.]